ncbi:MAG: hypothetical protein K8T90_01770 [Planctomycetes bacterium]|nr:hypothetical protein [Planctomycetota bacterium]
MADSTKVLLPALIGAFLVIRACGGGSTESPSAPSAEDLAAARAHANDAERRAQQQAVAASDALRRIADVRADADAAKAAADQRVKALEKERDRVTAHRDELKEWVEKELLPVAEEHQPELVNLREATTAMAAEVAKIRGLEWKFPVMRRRIRRDQVGEWMQRDMRKDLPEDKAKEMVLVGAEMGLVKPGTNIYDIFSEFMTGGAAAFYKPDTHTFYHIEGNDGRGAYPIVFHELVHAVEDQYFDLDAFYKVTENDSDRSFARRGVVEGSASYYQDLYQAKHPGDVQAMMKAQMAPDLMQRQAKMLSSCPAFLIATVGLYPYNNAKTWVGKVTGGDAAKLAALYTDPPESTEQVLHPEKFIDPATRDYPHNVAAPDMSSLPQDWKHLDPDSVGELQLACLMAQLKFPNGPAAFMNLLDPSSGGVALREPAKTAVMGWDGDRISTAIDPKTGRATLLWVSVWDTPRDAQEFVDGYAPLVGKKVTGESVAVLPSPVRFTEKGSDRITAIELRGTRVVVVLGTPPQFLDGLLHAGLATAIVADPRDEADAAQ